MSALVHLARHGQTQWHAENRYAGVSDVSLTQVGRDQAQRLGRWAALQSLAVVASSPLSRAVETAASVARIAALPHRVDADLRESDFGQGEGLTRTEMAAAFPDQLAAFLAAPASSPLPDGEAGASAAARFLTAVRRIAVEEPGPILVIAHTTVLRLTLCRLLGLPLDDYRRRFPELDNTAVTTIRFGEHDSTNSLIRYNAPI